MTEILKAATRDEEKLKTIHNFMFSSCLVVPLLYWFGAINTGPVEWLQAIGWIPASNDSESFGIVEVFRGFEHFGRAACSGGAWAIISAFFLWPFQRAIAIKYIGSEEAFEAALEMQRAKETTPISLGDLVHVAVNRGGFMDSDESTIETTQGFYRVSGKVGGVIKGASVTSFEGQLRITTPDGRGKEFVLLK
ncbi:hypothetical protein [Pseudomonas sp. UMAB-40]|uniref:hypothetical protein n=1 Tax=Pseudomonas sp. UMAB-40 TaxID=1365407 RepID=UPI001C592C6A|nr:hypothetical protein [Pseudomonas sp. UMAB-40]